jgi:hypothetical protein
MDGYSVWDEASRDYDSEARLVAQANLRVASTGVMQYLALAQTNDEFEGRLMLATASIQELSDSTGVPLDEVTASLRNRWEMLVEAGNVKLANNGICSCPCGCDAEDPNVCLACEFFGEHANKNNLPEYKDTDPFAEYDKRQRGNTTSSRRTAGDDGSSAKCNKCGFSGKKENWSDYTTFDGKLHLVCPQCQSEDNSTTAARKTGHMTCISCNGTGTTDGEINHGDNTCPGCDGRGMSDHKRAQSSRKTAAEDHHINEAMDHLVEDHGNGAGDILSQVHDDAAYKARNGGRTDVGQLLKEKHDNEHADGSIDHWHPGDEEDNPLLVAGSDDAPKEGPYLANILGWGVDPDDVESHPMVQHIENDHNLWTEFLPGPDLSIKDDEDRGSAHEETIANLHDQMHNDGHADHTHPDRSYPMGTTASRKTASRRTAAGNVRKRNGMWVIIDKKSGNVLSSHQTRDEAVAASKRLHSDYKSLKVSSQSSSRLNFNKTAGADDCSEDHAISETYNDEPTEPQLAMYKKYNVSPSDHRELTDFFGVHAHTHIMNHVHKNTPNGYYNPVWGWQRTHRLSSFDPQIENDMG